MKQALYRRSGSRGPAVLVALALEQHCIDCPNSKGVADEVCTCNVSLCGIFGSWPQGPNLFAATPMCI
jgi:hypothetical protein